MERLEIKDKIDIQNIACLAIALWMWFLEPHEHDLKLTTETDIPVQISHHKGCLMHHVGGLLDGPGTIARMIEAAQYLLLKIEDNDLPKRGEP